MDYKLYKLPHPERRAYYLNVGDAWYEFDPSCDPINKRGVEEGSWDIPLDKWFLSGVPLKRVMLIVGGNVTPGPEQQAINSTNEIGPIQFIQETGIGLYTSVEDDTGFDLRD